VIIYDSYFIALRFVVRMFHAGAAISTTVVKVGMTAGSGIFSLILTSR